MNHYAIFALGTFIGFSLGFFAGSLFVIDFLMTIYTQRWSGKNVSLITGIRSDITLEEKEIIKDSLWREFGEELLRKSIAGLPEWYKNCLLKNTFSYNQSNSNSYIVGTDGIGVATGTSVIIR